MYVNMCVRKWARVHVCVRVRVRIHMNILNIWNLSI